MDFKIHLIKLGGRKEGERKRKGGEGKRVSDYLLTHTHQLSGFINVSLHNTNRCLLLSYRREGMMVDG